MTLRTMAAVLELLVGSAMSDRTKVMTHTKRATLVLQVGVGPGANNTHSMKNVLLRSF